MRRHPGAYIGILLISAGCIAAVRAGDEPRPLADPRYPICMADWPVRLDDRDNYFIDDELIAEKHGVEQIIPVARKHPDNPVLRPDRPWADDMVLLYGSVLREPDTGRFRMWYLGRNFEDRNPLRTIVCYAESADGVHWEKPELGLCDYGGSRANNIVLLNHGGGLDTLTVLRDPAASDPAQRYKMFVYHFEAPAQPEGVYIYDSPDGLHWTERHGLVIPGMPVWPKNADNQFRGDVLMRGVGDVTYIYRDERLATYVANLKLLVNGQRARLQAESDDLLHWSRPRVILTPDAADSGTQLYGMVAFPFESLWLGVVQRYRATSDLTLDLTWAVSHDGRHWSRVTPRDPFVPIGPDGAWDDGNISPANNPPIRVGDELWFYYGGRDATHNTRPDIGAIGLATLPVGRFAALHAKNEGVVLTRPLHFAPGVLHVNADAAGGTLRVDVLDAAGLPLPGRSAAECTPLTANTLDAPVSWSGGNAIESTPQGVRLRFVLHDASLYAFRIVPQSTEKR